MTTANGADLAIDSSREGPRLQWPGAFVGYTMGGEARARDRPAFNVVSSMCEAIYILVGCKLCGEGLPSPALHDYREGCEEMDWEQRLAALWATLDEQDEEEFLRQMTALVAELPADDPVGIFERAASFDSTGHSDLAVPLYRQALALGLAGIRRRRAVIQLASSLRNLGHAEESVALLRAEREVGSDELDDAVSAVLALALVDTGHEREAVSVAVAALAPHLPRYQRSMANYARLLIEQQER